MGARPDEIRDEIEQTREELAYDVDRLADRTVPSRVVERRWEGVKEKARNMADTVMGARDTAQGKASDAGSTVKETASQATDKVKETASQASDKVVGTAQSVAGTVQQTPDIVARRTRGNPLAAGLIAFGVGWLVSSLLPATEKERQLAQQAETAVRENKDALLAPAKQVAQEIGDELKPAAQQAAQEVKATAQDAAQTVKDEGQSAAQDVKGQAQESKGRVQSSQGSSSSTI